MAGSIVFELEEIEPRLAAALKRPIVPVPFAPATATGLVTGLACWLVGWSFRETAGVAAAVDLFEGSDATGPLLAAIGLQGNAPNVSSWGPQGIPARSGIFLRLTTGAARGVVYIRV